MKLHYFLILSHCALIYDVYGRCSTGQSECPRHCNCESLLSGHLRVDCSDKQLSQPPSMLPNNTAELNLRRNDIKRITRDNFLNCALLIVLDLSHNHLEHISSDSFSSTTGIEQLYLNDNHLQYDNLPSNLFGKLEKLSVFHIHNNAWHKLTRYPENLVTGLSNLRVLSLDAFSGAHFGDQFSVLDSLRLLHVHGGLDVIRNNTFASFRESSVEELALKTKMSLNKIEPASFSHFGELRTLDLSYNQGLGFTNVSTAWWGLRFTKITKLILTRIVSPDEQAASLKVDFFKFLNSSKIETLLIDRNNIVEMEPLISRAFPHLVYLDISYNRITNIASVLSDIVFLVNLTYLDFSRQAKRYVDNEGGLTRKRSVSHVSQITNGASPRTAQNDVRDAEDWFLRCRTPHFRPCPLPFSESSKTLLTAVKHDFNKGVPLPDYGTWCIIGPPKLEILILTESLNVDLRTLPAMVLMHTRGFKRLEYRNNGIENLANSLLLTIPSNVSVDFSNNRISCFSPDIFNYSSSLGSNIIELYLSGNRLAEQLELDINGTTLRGLTELKILDLSLNGIKSMSQNGVRYSLSLEKLDLSQNSLRTFDIDISHLKKLNSLNISNNLLTTFDSNITDELTNIFRSTSPNGNLSIDLTGNPLQCSCNTLPFLHWISANRKHMTNFLKYACWFNESYVTFSHLNNIILVELQYKCSQRLAVVVSATLCALFLVLIAISVCMYRYRWEVRYWCLWLTQRSRLYREQRDDNDYDFDAFVSYTGFDGDWVRHQLVPHLEADNTPSVTEPSLYGRQQPESENEIITFRLCLHERDFLPGNDIFDNIWSKMDRSRKVILVISPSFARSSYCDFEINLARKASFERARNLFVPIILEPTEVEDMSDGLRWIVRKLTYIEWPRGEHQEVERMEFWNTLRDALADHGLNLNFQRN